MSPIERSSFQKVFDFCGKVPVLNIAVGGAKIVKAGFDALVHLTIAHLSKKDAIKNLANKYIQQDLSNLKYGALYALIPVWGGMKADSLRAEREGIIKAKQQISALMNDIAALESQIFTKESNILVMSEHISTRPLDESEDSEAASVYKNKLYQEIHDENNRIADLTRLVKSKTDSLTDRLQELETFVSLGGNLIS